MTQYEDKEEWEDARDLAVKRCFEEGIESGGIVLKLKNGK